MKYNSKLFNRRSIRLKQYDYSTPGIYFITICTQNRQCLLGNIDKNNNCRGGACSAQTLKLNHLGKIIEKEWIELKNRYSNIQLDEYIVMPNHLHGIISINEFTKGRSKPRPYNRRYNLCI